jgi:hypothetical protein
MDNIKISVTVVNVSVPEEEKGVSFEFIFETLLCYLVPVCDLGHAVVQLVEALSYKPEGSIPDGVIGIFL